jgi:hypothetical protein
MVSGFLLSSFVANAKTYQTKDSFEDLVLSTTTNHTSFISKTLWLKKPLQDEIRLILNHSYPKLRLRYKISVPVDNTHANSHSPTTIWTLEEIGKERPITFGISVKDSNIQLIRVLEYRESRGYEIHIPAFTEQFDQMTVNSDGQLGGTIDGITGATMSVNAMKKIARLAILLHNTVNKKINTIKQP